MEKKKQLKWIKMHIKVIAVDRIYGNY